MQIRYCEEHHSCYNFVHDGEGPREYAPGICTERYEKGRDIEKLVAVTEIVFLLEGSFSVSFNGIENVDVAQGQVILLPVGNRCRITVTETSHLIIFTIPQSIKLCDAYSLEHLFKEKHKVKKA